MNHSQGLIFVFAKQQKIPFSSPATFSFEISKMHMMLQEACVLERILASAVVTSSSYTGSGL